MSHTLSLIQPAANRGPHCKDIKQICNFVFGVGWQLQRDLLYIHWNFIHELTITLQVRHVASQTFFQISSLS